MAKLISAINNSGLYAQYAASAEKDSKGNVITATYLTNADLAGYALESEVADSIAELSSTVDDNFYPLNTNPKGYLVNDDITGKLDTTTFTSYTATADAVAYTAGSNIDITSHVISGKDWTSEIADASADALTAVANKFEVSNNKITGYDGSAFANDTYTAGAGIDITNNEISVTGAYVTSAGAGLTGNLVLNNNQWVEMPEMGGYTTAAGTGADLHPNVQSPSYKLIYLVQDTTATGPDTYKEWIYSSEDAWVLIGDTTLDLTNYASTAWVDGNYVGTASTASWDVTPYTAGANIDITNNVVSGKDWTSTIETASGNAVTNVEGKFGFNEDDEITGYNNSAFATPDLTDYVTDSELSTALAGYVTTATNQTLSSNVATLVAASSTWDGKQDALTNEQLSAISSVSGKQDALTNEQLSAISSVSGKQDALTNEQLSAISSVSGKQDTLTFSYATIGE